MWWTIHNIAGSFLHTKAHVWHTGGSHDDPKNLDGSKWINGVAIGILERKTDEQCSSLSNVLSQNVEDETFNIIEETATLFDGVEDRGEVVIGQNNVGSLFGNVRTSLTLQ